MSTPLMRVGTRPPKALDGGGEKRWGGDRNPLRPASLLTWCSSREELRVRTGIRAWPGEEEEFGDADAAAAVERRDMPCRDAAPGSIKDLRRDQ